MEYKDYYKIMGLGRDATQDEIKRTYRKLARKFHPDVSKEPSAEERFKEIGEAYEVLKDPEKRVAYDQLGSGWQAGEQFRPPPDWGTGFEFSGGGFRQGDASAFSDFFEALFGRGFRGGVAQPGTGAAFHAQGADHHARVLIDIEDAYHGTIRRISLRVPEVDAQGRVTTRERSLNVRIPKGVRPGQQIRLSGQGGTGTGKGRAGDLYLEVAFRPHPLYQVDGRDVFLTLPVAPWEAALGATVKVPTPSGVVDIKVPAGSASGRRLRLRGRGIPGDPAGDLYAVLQVVLPAADSESARQLYRDMEQQLGFNPRARLGV
ncbi:MAG: DnaJ C-terminal domain-containing protein [Pseudomonadota bacterium]